MAAGQAELLPPGCGAGTAPSVEHHVDTPGFPTAGLADAAPRPPDTENKAPAADCEVVIGVPHMPVGFRTMNAITNCEVTDMWEGPV